MFQKAASINVFTNKISSSGILKKATVPNKKRLLIDTEWLKKTNKKFLCIDGKRSKVQKTMSQMH